VAVTWTLTAHDPRSHSSKVAHVAAELADEPAAWDGTSVAPARGNMRRLSSTMRAAISAPAFLSLVLLTACTFDGSAPGTAGGGDDDGPGTAGDGGSDIGGRGDGGLPVDGGGGGGSGDAGPPPDGAPPPDAGQGDPCDGKCLAPGVCEEATGTCVFDCSDQSGGGGDGGDMQLGGGDPCPDVVVCPAGIPCRVECTGRRSCGGGIDCTDAASCDLVCSGRESCDGTLDCGSGSCDIECGQDSCRQAIHCQNACVCNVDCHPSACGMEADCPAGCDQMNDCNVAGQCNTCDLP
jgi:hypothetical protein